MKKLPVDATTIVSIANWPNLYFFYLRAIIVAKQNATSVEGIRLNQSGVLYSRKVHSIKFKDVKPDYMNCHKK